MMPVGPHACMHACIHAYMKTCRHEYMHIYIHTCVRTCMHAYICICIHCMECMHMPTCSRSQDRHPPGWRRRTFCRRRGPADPKMAGVPGGHNERISSNFILWVVPLHGPMPPGSLFNESLMPRGLTLRAPSWPIQPLHAPRSHRPRTRGSKAISHP